ncbi:MAG: carbamoyltransferase [Flavobacteriales bacterium]|nr:carbamoyltransferase [Flavobacteriales bacterium]
MYILGINAYHGDSSACLIKDGNVVCACEEERITRVKHWAGFPIESIKFCLDDQKISIKDIDYITISRDPKANIFKKIIYTIKNHTNLNNLRKRFNNALQISSIKNKISEGLRIPKHNIKAKIFNIEHHRSHLASSFFASKFDKSAVVSIDGFGDFTSTMTAIGIDNKLKVIKTVNYPHSIGIFYTAATQFLGFKNYGDEYKVMGLSSYGKPIYINELKKIIRITDDGLFKLNNNYFLHFKEGVSMKWSNGSPNINILYSPLWNRIFGNARNKNEDINQHHMNIASSVQKYTEIIICNMLNKLYDKVKLKNLCLSGGVIQNSVLNGKIIEKTKFENIYIPAAAHDAGTSIGSGLYLYNQILRNKRLPASFTSYLGSKFKETEIIDLLRHNNIQYRKLNDNDLYNEVSNNLISGGVVGWFQGRAEFGPRALGHRSILVDPRREDAKEILNIKIKRRERFRPFAPSILREFISEYFNINESVPFMEKVYLIKKEKRKKIPAVTHIDGTGRLQTVDKRISPKYHALITNFFEKTSIPILLNTSFNENEPIVNTPKEALDCFLRTKMDLLVMENIIIKR